MQDGNFLNSASKSLRLWIKKTKLPKSHAASANNEIMSRINYDYDESVGPIPEGYRRGAEYEENNEDMRSNDPLEQRYFEQRARREYY